MQVILLLIEFFLPEIAKQLAGKDSDSLRRRLSRSGMLLLVLALLIFAWSLFDHMAVQNLPLGQFDPFGLSIFTAWLLIMTGLGLLMLSRHENSKGLMKPINRPPRTIINLQQVTGAEILVSPCSIQIPIVPHQRVIKTKIIGFRDCFDGVVPDAEWGFFIADQYCRVVNNSVSGSRLYVNDLLAAQDRTKMRFGLHTQPALQAKIIDTAGKGHEVAIYFRAWLHIRIRVVVNGKYISEKFV